MKNYYEDAKEDVFVPLECVDECYQGRYEINRQGDIRIKTTKRVLKLITKNVDYPRVILRNAGNTKHYFIHVLIAKTFIPNPDPINKTQVNHINRDHFDYSIPNLEWTSPSENLKARGEHVSWNRLSYIKIDDNGNEIEILKREEIPVNIRKRIIDASSSGNKYDGFYWKRVDTEVINYYSKFTEEELKSEQWKVSNDYPNILVSSLGLIKTVKGITVGYKNLYGYRTVNLNKKCIRVHRLVAETFISGKKLGEKEVIDHLNGERDFNAVWNLKICKDQKENLENPLTYKKDIKSVGKYDLNGNFIEKYDSILQAYKSLGLSPNSSKISVCCREKQLKAYGYLWAYLDGTEEDVIKRKLSQL